MKVYLLHVYSDDLHSVLGVYSSVDKAIESARSIANQSGLEEQFDCIGGTVLAEFANDSYDTVVWVEDMEVIE